MGMENAEKIPLAKQSLQTEERERCFPERVQKTEFGEVK